MCQIGIRLTGEIGDFGSAVATPNGSSRKKKKKRRRFEENVQTYNVNALKLSLSATAIALTVYLEATVCLMQFFSP